MTHLSALALDALALGTLDPAAEARARAHLASCARCRADSEAAAAERAHFSAYVMARTAPVAPRRWALWLALPAVAAAVALLALALRDPAGERAPELAPELAIKGGPTWHVFANRDGRTFAVHDGTPLAAGDRIRFAVAPAGARYLLVASIDGAGAVTIYFPYGGSESAPLAAGVQVELPGSIVLDAAPGPERMFAVFSDEPIATAAIARQLRAIGNGGADAIRSTHSLAVARARAQTTVVFEKAPP